MAISNPNDWQSQYVEMNPALYAWHAQHSGLPFNSADDPYSYQFGPGTTVSGQSLYDQGFRDVAVNSQYYKPTSGNMTPQNTLPSYNPVTFGNYAWLIPAMIATGGLAAGALTAAGTVAGAEGAATIASELAAGGFTSEQIAGALAAKGMGQSAATAAAELALEGWSAEAISSGLSVVETLPQSQGASFLEQLQRVPSNLANNFDWSNVDWGRVISAGGSLLQTVFGPNAADYAKDAAAMADPFAGQRPYYQNQLKNELKTLQTRSDRFPKDFVQFQNRFERDYNKNRNQTNQRIESFNRRIGEEFSNFRSGFREQYNDFREQGDRMFNDPNYWAQNSLLAGLNQNTINDTSRAMAAQGYNMSGNQMAEIAQRLQNNNAQFAGQQQQNYTNYGNSFLGQYANANLNNMNTFFNARGQNIRDQGQLNNQSLGTFAQTGLGQGQNWINYLGNQTGLLNTIGNFAGANASDPSRAGYLYQQGMNYAGNQYNNMYGAGGYLLNQFLNSGGSTSQSALT